jgi:hypothetical protein
MHFHKLEMIKTVNMSKGKIDTKINYLIMSKKTVRTFYLKKCQYVVYEKTILTKTSVSFCKYREWDDEWFSTRLQTTCTYHFESTVN